MLQGAGEHTAAVPSVMQQARDLRGNVQQAERQLYQHVTSVDQQAAPGLWAAMEEGHEGVFGVREVQAPSVQAEGQGAVLEHMQVSIPRWHVWAS